jgi:hypothetical protein
MFFSCKESKTTEYSKIADGVHEVIAKEVLHVSEYSYVKVTENKVEKWIAAPLGKIDINATYYFEKPMEMRNFESKELGRTFEVVYFVDELRSSREPGSVVKGNPHGTNIDNLGTKPVAEKKAISIKSSDNTITIADLFEKRDQYNNKVVRIKGEVTKYNPAIMNVNWMHLQDGSDYQGEFDLTVTTEEEVQVGDIVTIEGVVILNKDFGAGYFYNVIVEQATRIN